MLRRFALVMTGLSIASTIGCSDPASLPAEGAMAITIDPPAVGACSATGTYTVPQGPDAYTEIVQKGENDDIRVKDGRKGATVECTVSGSGNFSLYGLIQVPGANFAVSGDITSQGGMVTIVETDPNSGITGEGLCEITPKFINSGAIWATFTCPEFGEELVTCSAEGGFIFENCKK